MCCYGYDIADKSINCGSRGVLNFRGSIDDSSAMYYNCLILHSLLHKHDSFSTLKNITDPAISASGINSAEVKINGLHMIDKWLSGIIYVGGENKYDIDFYNKDEILELSQRLKPINTLALILRGVENLNEKS